MRKSHSLSLTAVGDIMLGDSSTCVGFGFHSRYPGREASKALADVGDRLRRADIVFGNLECTLTASGSGATRWRRDQMRGDPEYASVLREIGFTVIGVANNHATQHGRPAFEETVQHLRASGIPALGVRGKGPWTCEPVILDLAAGQRAGLLGYCWRPRQYEKGDPPFAEGTLGLVLEDIARLRDSVDAIVISLHWGEEFVGQPSESEVVDAHAMIEAGALAVIGHHPHVRRPCERVGQGVIAYSLGNFVTDMLWQDRLRSGAILDCTWSGGRLAATVTPTMVDRDYRPRPGEPSTLDSGDIVGLTAGRYQQEIAAALRAQRIAGYRYAALHLHRYPPGVLSELAWTTLKNKLSAVRRALGWNR